VAVLPAFAHARRNSRLVAAVSGDSTKRRLIGRRYRVPRAFDYDAYDECLREVDAVYIALPNSMHAEYAIRTARAGFHVLVEKPMAVTVPECRQMIEAARRSNVKLMVAYRLHFESLNLAAIDLARRGRLGELKFFNSTFSMTVRPGDIRTKRACGGGTLYDIGVYCINAARNLFRAEPTEVSAVSINSGSATLAEVDETTAAVLRFGSERLATFVTSFNAAAVGAYRIVGSRGELHADPAYEYAERLSYRVTVGGRTTKKTVGKRDQFAAELLYFSDCILDDRKPRAVRGRRNAGRADRPGALSLGPPGQTGAHPCLHEAKPANRPSTNRAPRRAETAARESTGRKRGLRSHAMENTHPRTRMAFAMQRIERRVVP
jgi:glucose-fructose oxidoreductase